MPAPEKNGPETYADTYNHLGDEGYLLVGLVVACFIILLFLAIAAPRVAKELERDKEVESEQRALQYVRAIQLYYRKNNSYPTSVEQLLGSGTSGASFGPGSVRYLRQAYKDPLTNGEYRLILMGQAKTQVKGFFGEPLQGGLGANSGIGGTPAAAMGGTTPGTSVGNTSTIGGSTPGSSPTSGSGFSLGGSSFGSGSGSSFGGGATPGSAQAGTPGTSGTSGTPGTATPGSTDATTFTGSSGKGMFVGVGSNAKGPGLVEWNGSANIEEWEFLYDPRVELLKAKVSLLGGTPAANGSGSLGGGITPTSGTTGLGGGFGTPTSGASGSGFGSSPGSGFGSSPGSGSSSPTSPTTGTTPATPPSQ